MRAFLISAAVVIAGCGSGGRPASSAPVEGTVVNNKMSIDEQIQKIQADKNIPENYKQSYINSLKQKAAQGGK